MDELEHLEAGIAELQEKYGIDEKAESQPLTDEVLEKPLTTFETMANRYFNADDPLHCYDLQPDDHLELVGALNSLNSELITRSQGYRKSLDQRSPYPNTAKGRIYKAVDTILGQKEFRERDKRRMIDQNIILNPYKEARTYTDIILGKMVTDKQIVPEVFLTATNTIRGFDHAAKKNLITMI